MESSRFIRWGGLAAVLGEILLLVVTPLAGAAYYATGADGGAPPPFVSAMRSWLHPMLTWGSPDIVYLTYGKVFAPIAGTFLLGLLALHAHQARRAGRLERWGFRVLVVGLALGSLSAFVEYWVGPALGSATVTDMAFMLLSLPGMLLMLLGSPLFGLGTLRAHVVPRLGAWLLILGLLPFGIVLNLVLGHFSSMLLLFGLGWMIIGYHLWSHQPAPAPSAGAMLSEARRSVV